MKRPPSYSDTYTGLASITIPYGTGTIEMSCSWEVAAESLDYRIEEMKTIRNDGSLCVHYTREKLLAGDYLVPLDLKNPEHDRAIRSALWDEIGPSIPFLPESHYVA